MKNIRLKFAFAFLAFWPQVGSAFECGALRGRDLSTVCKRYVSAVGKAACFEAGNGAKLDRCALGLCDTYPTEEGCTRCIVTVRDKRYLVAEIADCNQYEEEDDTTACLKELGTPVKGSLQE